MNILPVIDLLDGLVVRGIGGRRDCYRPLISQIAADAQAATVAAAYRKLGFAEAYVADLDALAGREPAWSQYAAIANAGLKLWLDCGLASLERTRQLAALQWSGQPLHRILVGLETLASIERLQQIIAAVDRERLVFSLDLQQGIPRTSIPAWQNCSPVEIASEVSGYGIRRLLVLDLADVGESRGTSVLALCRQIRALDAEIELISGGGIRNRTDLDALAATGCDVALVASALHDGQLVTSRDW